MTDKTKHVEEYAIKKLLFLDAYGFERPTTNKDKWCTTISCSSVDISIEVELDWRELDVFVLLRAIQNDGFSGGYYVSGGKRCRIHLEKFLKDSCAISEDVMRSSLRKQPPRSERNETTMKSHIDDYMWLLRRTAVADPAIGPHVILRSTQLADRDEQALLLIKLADLVLQHREEPGLD
ncbi:MAG: hypothetical protein GX174_10890, partial [Lentisphaerae bacterium]|nr:hypothetical protein [Lentisphaerota bacterium]